MPNAIKHYDLPPPKSYLKIIWSVVLEMLPGLLFWYGFYLIVRLVFFDEKYPIYLIVHFINCIAIFVFIYSVCGKLYTRYLFLYTLQSDQHGIWVAKAGKEESFLRWQEITRIKFKTNGSLSLQNQNTAQNITVHYELINLTELITDLALKIPYTCSLESYQEIGTSKKIAPHFFIAAVLLFIFLNILYSLELVANIGLIVFLSYFANYLSGQKLTLNKQGVQLHKEPPELYHWADIENIVIEQLGNKKGRDRVLVIILYLRNNQQVILEDFQLNWSDSRYSKELKLTLFRELYYQWMAYRQEDNNLSGDALENEITG